MKLTLLDIVQGLLDDTGEEQVDTINDSPVSERYARLIKREYDQLMSERDWPHLSKIVQFSPLGTAKPTHLIISEGTKKVSNVFYNKRKSTDTKDKLEVVKYLTPENFLLQTNQRSSDKANVTTVLEDNGVPLLINNDTAPTYWTSFDDSHIIFDSYDSDVEATIQDSKQQITVYIKEDTFLVEDDYIADLPDEAFPLLYNRCLLAASTRQSNETDAVAARHVNKGETWLSQNARRTGSTVKWNTMGRKPALNRARNNPLFGKD